MLTVHNEPGKVLGPVLGSSVAFKVEHWRAEPEIRVALRATG